MELTLKQRYLLMAAICTVSILADQLTKVWARGALRSPEPADYIDQAELKKKEAIRIIEHRFEFRLSFNRGSAFGMFNRTEGARWWLVVVGIGALGLIGFLLHRPEGKNLLFVVALSLVAGGAIGNLIDRIAFGKVTDFIVVWLTSAISMTYPWPAFNVADAVLVMGVSAMVVQIIYTMIHPPPEEEEAKPSKKKSSRPQNRKK